MALVVDVRNMIKKRREMKQLLIELETKRIHLDEDEELRIDHHKYYS